MNIHEEIELWIDNFDVTSQSVGDLEQEYEDLLREDKTIESEQLEKMIYESEGLDWKSIAYMTASLLVSRGYTCASLIEGYGETFVCKRSGKTEHMDNGFLVPKVGMVIEEHMTDADWDAWDKHNGYGEEE